MKLKRLITIAGIALAAAGAGAGVQIDRSAMSKKYWSVWNAKEQARIDADIEANRKADATVSIDALDEPQISGLFTRDMRQGVVPRVQGPLSPDVEGRERHGAVQDSRREMT